MRQQGLALVTGATGSIGPALVERLIDSGYDVRTMSRGAALPEWNAVGVEHVQGDITHAPTIERALDGVNVVFHLAALLHIENPGPEMQDAYYRVNVDGTRHILNRAVQSGATRFVYFSTVKVYGARQRIPVTEEFEPAPMTEYARTKLEGERIVAGESGTESVILRLSPVYGPRVKGSWARLISAIAKNRFVPVGSLDNVHSVTHVDDVTRAALVVAQHPQAAGSAYNLVAHETPTFKQILQAIYASQGRVLPTWRLPASGVLMAASMAEGVFRLIGRRWPLPAEIMRQLIDDEAYSGFRLRQLGFSPHVAISEGWDVLP